MKQPIKSLSVFFPVHNEAAVLPTLVEQAREDLANLGIKDYELIIVDDGSFDGSGPIADRLSKQWPEVRVVHHATNRGYGAALRTGFEEARKDWVMYTDGDGQFRLADLAKLFPYAAAHDVVLGYRARREDHLGRKFNALVWTLAVRWMLGLKVKDVDCAFKLVRSSALKQVLPLHSEGAVISAELLVKLQREGHQLVQTPVRHYPRQSGQSSGADPQVILRALRELWWLRGHMQNQATRPSSPARRK